MSSIAHAVLRDRRRKCLSVAMERLSSTIARTGGRSVFANEAVTTVLRSTKQEIDH